MPNETAIIYARQSSGKEDGSASIEMQIQQCQELAKRKKIKVIGIFSDANTSGRLYPTGAEALIEADFVMQQWFKAHNNEKKTRQGLGSVISNINNADYVIVYDLTRLYRPLQGSYMQDYVDMNFRMNNTQILSVKEGTINIFDSSEQMLRNIKSDINDTQMKITNDKSKLALRKLRDDGIIPTCPKMFGVIYKGGKDKVVEIDKEAAKVIRFVYDRIIALDSYNSIIRKLNELFPHLCSGKGYYSTSLRHIAAQPFYCGYMYDTDRSLVRAKQMIGKEIVTLEEWQKVQNIMNRKRREPKGRNQSIHPFTHLLYCGECGSKMVVGMDDNKEFYHCYHGANDMKNEGCRDARININLVRKSVEFIGLREAIAPVLALALYKDLENAELSTYEMKRIADLKQKLEAYIKRKEILVNKYTECGMDIELFSATCNELNKRIKSIKSEIFEIENAICNRDSVITKVSKHFQNIDNVVNNKLDDTTFEDLLHKAVRKIICYRDRIDVETVYGNFTLKRYMKYKYRNMPRFKYEFRGLNKKTTNISQTQLVVTYDYTGADNKEKNQLIVDFGVMKISSSNANDLS